ncbi:MAG: hypothetical protein ACHQQS_03560 [Thermoanaerobaculales bacterium]
MNARQLHQLMRLARALPGQLRQPVTPDAALSQLREGLLHRERNFLTASRRLIFDNPASPYRSLLLWAGCDFADLQHSVQAHGLDRTLEQLRDAGVYLTLDEFKRQAPICRKGLTLKPRETDFDNSGLAAAGFEGATSGTHSPATRVFYDWEFIREEAAHELLLYEHHGVLNAPLALWYPVPPALAGVHNLLMNLKHGHTPARWFSHLDPTSSHVSLRYRVALMGLRWGSGAPRPEFAELSRPDNVLDWMQTNPRCVLRTFTSSAVRLVQHALRRGVDIAGATVFTGGEPLTDARRAFIESAGVTVFARYVASESGLIAASCRHRTSTDDMHVYIDRLAVIPGLCYTTLSLHTGKVLFNTELGDAGELSTRPCKCGFGQLGFDLHVRDVRSRQRLTIEGMTVATADLDQVLGQLIGADSFQYRQAHDERGLTRLVIAISPDAGDLPSTEVVYNRMRQHNANLAVVADVWQRVSAIEIVREQPVPSPGYKVASTRRSA